MIYENIWTFIYAERDNLKNYFSIKNDTNHSYQYYTIYVHSNSNPSRPLNIKKSCADISKIYDDTSMFNNKKKTFDSDVQVVTETNEKGSSHIFAEKGGMKFFVR